MRLRGKLIAVVCTLAMVGACGAETGDDIASDTIDKAIDDFSDRMDRYLTSNQTGEHLAAVLDQMGAERRPADARPSLRIDPLSWAGESDEGAVVEVRISAAVPAYDSGTMFGRSHRAGDAVRCFRLTMRTSQRVATDDIECPKTALPPAPSPAEAADLPPDAEERMRDVLRSTTPAKLAGDVRSAFASTDWFTDTAIEDDRMVATVGTVGGGQCLVAYRDGRGAVKFPYIPREWLMPGEIGCHPSVVLAPPL